MPSSMDTAARGARCRRGGSGPGTSRGAPARSARSARPAGVAGPADGHAAARNGGFRQRRCRRGGAGGAISRLTSDHAWRPAQPGEGAARHEPNDAIKIGPACKAPEQGEAVAKEPAPARQCGPARLTSRLTAEASCSRNRRLSPPGSSECPASNQVRALRHWGSVYGSRDSRWVPIHIWCATGRWHRAEPAFFAIGPRARRRPRRATCAGARGA